MPLFALLALLSPSSHGTLLLTVPTKTGIVMCADRREYNPVRGATDNQDKIFKLSASSAFSITGNRGILKPKDLKASYDVSAVVLNFFKDHRGPYTNTDWDDLKIELGQSYFRHLTSGGAEWVPADAEDGLVYTLTFVFTDQNKKPQIVRVATRIAEGALNVDGIDYPIDKPLGQTAVIGELKSGENKAFDQARTNSLVKAFLSGSKNEGNTTAQEAVDYSKSVIQTTSRLYHLLSSEPALVSENYDCAQVGSAGFSWLKQNAK